jgi:hypothetical protein
MIRIAVIALGVLLSFAANAATVRVGQYLHPKNDWEKTFSELYLDGTKDGLFVYNVLTTDKKYCPPKDFVLTTEQADDVVRRWVKKQTRNVEEMVLGQALLYGLQEIFPCSQ